MNNTTQIHNVFSCECHEPCSHCTAPELKSSLRVNAEGARLCRDCRRAEAFPAHRRRMEEWA